MKRFCLFALLAISVLSLFAKRMDPYDGSRIFWDMRSQQTLFNDGWYSRMIQLQDGRLLAASESCWNVIISYSDDMGETWSPQETVFLPPAGLRYFDVDLCQLSDGKIIITYNIGFPDNNIAPEGRFGVRLRISEDNGQTWSDDIFVYDGEREFENGTWEPNILELPSGELHLYVSDEAPYTHSGEQCIQLFRSFDKGYTWEGPETISFRPGARDGMPTSLLLGDTIVVTIEDNGWPGMGSFIPVTVRTTLEDNWKSGPVGAGSPMRSMVIDHDWCPQMFGCAPYMRVMQSGETILSRQSFHKSGEYGLMNMFVYVGDENGRGFKAMSQPFPDNLESRISIEVNSVSVVGDSTIYALGGFVSGPSGRHVDIVRGFPVKTLRAYYGTPTLDGVIEADEYNTPEADQVKMGTNNLGQNVYADFNYDENYLYFVATVDDNTPMPTPDYSRTLKDGVKLLVDADNVSDDTPVKGMYELYFIADGKIECRQGDNGTWKTCDATGIACEINNSDDHYVMEAAIPWSFFGKETAPEKERMAVGIEVTDRRGNSFKSESIPDVKHDQSWTWVEFRLDGDKENNGLEAVAMRDKHVNTTLRNGIMEISCDTGLSKVALFSADGQMRSQHTVSGTACSLRMGTPGVLLAIITLADGSVVCRKVINR